MVHRTGHDSKAIRAAGTLDGLRTIACEDGHPPELLAIDGTSPVHNFARAIRTVLVIDAAGEAHLFVNFSNGKAIYVKPVESEPRAAATRLEAPRASLENRSESWGSAPPAAKSH